MYFSYLDKEEYKDIPIFDIKEANMSELPVHIRKYKQAENKSNFHRHAYIQIIYVYKGKGTHYIDNNKNEISKGDIFVIPPYIPHKIVPDNNEVLEIFEFEFDIEFIIQNQISREDAKAYLDFAYLEPFVVGEGYNKPRFNLDGKTQAIVEEMLGEALEEYREKRPSYILYIKAVLLKLLVIIGRVYAKEMKESEIGNVYSKYKNAISEAMKYINENYNNEITVKEVSKAINYSQSHFSYLFKCITASTFTEYLHNIRITKAIELLKNTNMRITDISYEVGFNNIQHFNRIFKQFTGVSPRGYRNRGN